MNIIKNGSVDDLEHLERPRERVERRAVVGAATRRTTPTLDCPVQQWTLYSGYEMHALGSIDLKHKADAVFIVRARTELPRIVAELKKRRDDHRDMVRLLGAVLKANGGTISISRQLLNSIDGDAIVDADHDVLSNSVNVRLLEPPQDQR